MPRKSSDLNDSVEPSVSQPTISLNLDIAELVELARNRFGKRDKDKAAITKYMTTADQIVLSTNKEDYITSPTIEKLWKPLTGIMGIPFGRIIQIAGKADSGKSTLAMMIMKAAQEAGVLVVLWDAEGKFDSSRFRNRIGGNPDIVPVAPSRNILDGTLQVVAFVKSALELNPKQKILIVWDSVGSSINSAEDEENDDYSKQPGVTAKEVSWAIRRINQLIEKYKDLDTGNYTIAGLCVNQVYANIGSRGFKQKGGGELEYLSSLILEFTRTGDLTRQRGNQKYKFGIKTIARIKKNHLFGAEDCIAELPLIVDANGVHTSDEVDSSDLESEDD